MIILIDLQRILEKIECNTGLPRHNRGINPMDIDKYVRAPVVQAMNNATVLIRKEGEKCHANTSRDAIDDRNSYGLPVSHKRSGI